MLETLYLTLYSILWGNHLSLLLMAVLQPHHCNMHEVIITPPPTSDVFLTASLETDDPIPRSDFRICFLARLCNANYLRIISC